LRSWLERHLLKPRRRHFLERYSTNVADPSSPPGLNCGDGSQLYRGKSREQGTFRFGRMEPGVYTLAIDQAGFCKAEISSIKLKASEQKTLQRFILRTPDDKGDCR
jgi:hypothetical protein